MHSTSLRLHQLYVAHKRAEACLTSKSHHGTAKSLFHLIIRNKRTLYSTYHNLLCLFCSNTMALYIITISITGTMPLYLFITADLLTLVVLVSRWHLFSQSLLTQQQPTKIRLGRKKNRGKQRK